MGARFDEWRSMPAAGLQGPRRRRGLQCRRTRRGKEPGGCVGDFFEGLVAQRACVFFGGYDRDWLVADEPFGSGFAPEQPLDLACESKTVGSGFGDAAGSAVDRAGAS